MPLWEIVQDTPRTSKQARQQAKPRPKREIEIEAIQVIGPNDPGPVLPEAKVYPKATHYHPRREGLTPTLAGLVKGMKPKAKP